MKGLRHIRNVLLFIFMGSLSFGQTEDELIKRAGKLFEQEEYVGATPLYLRLLSVHPKNSDYNFRYGACLLFNSNQKKEAIRYLNFAVKDPEVDPRAFYFHGKSLHLNYQFEHAKKSYVQYRTKRSKKDKRYAVERDIEMCTNGKQLLTTFTDIIVSEKKEIDNSKFFRLYRNMGSIGGDILVSAEFQSRIDKRRGHVPVVYFPKNANAIFYSSFGDDESTGKDIFIRRRLPDGSWGEPQLIQGAVNTSEDEDFPYMHPSGQYLYFSSRGHNSMGGYDIFRSSFDPSTNSFGKPENVDFAISSPDDDLFYVVDSLYENAFFASARQSENGKLHVYRIRVARVPIQEVIVIGDFLSEVAADNRVMNVKVRSQSNGAEIGTFRSNKNGEYSFVFPNGGAYEYEVNIEGSDDTYKFIVELPYLDEFRPLKQKALHTLNEGNEVVKVINLFDEGVAGAEALMAEVIRKRSELEVNVNNYDLDALNEQQARNKVLAEMGFENMSLNEVAGQLEELAITEKLELAKADQIESNINAEIVVKSKSIEQHNINLKGLLDRAAKTEVPAEKHSLLLEAQQHESEKEFLSSEIESLEELKLQALDETVARTSSKENKIEMLESQFKALLEEDNEKGAMELLEENSSLIREAQDRSPDKVVKELIDESVALNSAVSKLQAQQLELERTIDQLESRIILLNNSLVGAKKKEGENIREELEEKQTELELARELLEDTRKQMDSENKKLNKVDNNLASLQKAMLKEDVSDTRAEEVVASLGIAAEARSEVDKSTVNEQISALEKEYPELDPDYIAVTTPEVKVTEADVLKELRPDHENELAKIEENGELNQLEKLSALQGEEEKLIAALEQEENKVEQELDKDPENKELIDRKEVIRKLLDQKQDIVSERAQTIDAMRTTAVVTENSEVKERLERELNESYKTERVQVEESELDPFEKNSALLEKDVEQLEVLSEKERTLDRALERDPENSKLQIEAELVATLIAEQEKTIEKQKKEAENSITKEVISESIAITDKSYSSDIEELKRLEEPSRFTAVAEREQILQDKLQAAIKDKDKELERRYSVDAALERATLEKALSESKLREDEARNTVVTVTVDSEETKEEFVAQLRKDANDGDPVPIEKEYTSKAELLEQDEVLEKYAAELDTKIVEVETQVRRAPENEKLQNNLEWLEQEKELVAEKRRRIRVTLGELETIVIANETANEGSNATMDELITEEQRLEDKLRSPELSSVEEKDIRRHLDEVRREKTELQDQMVTESLTEETQENEQLTESIEKMAETDSDNRILTQMNEINTTEQQEINEILEDAEKAKTTVEKIYLLNRAAKEQEDLNNDVRAVVVDQKINSIEEQQDITLMSKEELQKKRRVFTVELGELTTQIIRTEKEIKTAKKRDLPELETEKTKLIVKRSLVENQLRAVEERLLEQPEAISVVDKRALEKEISFNEERKTAGEEEYEDYYTLATKALDTERELSKLEEQVKETRNEIVTLVALDSIKQNDETIQRKARTVKELQAEIDRLRIELVQEKYLADEALPVNEEKAMKMQNLAARGVRPIQTIAVAAALIQMPSNGLAIDTESESHYTEENPIPVDVESPSGLVYRVQIGAFARAIPQDLFKEFNPVSGEKISGTNITRYMAGFFNNSELVVSAREQIRGLGYSDAFVVAYCDGERIGFGDARRREQAGTCVPKGTNELMLEVSVKTAEKLGLPTTNEVQEVPENTYNQSPGAAKADPIEIKQGLFFTVQIGVFNRPVGSEYTYDMPELMTIRLPNGQIRYASGMFNSVEEALPRRKEALARGVVGAFVTAYYKGERIPLYEARKLLAELGPSILQSELEKEVVVETVTTPVNVVRTDTATSVNVVTVDNTEQISDYIQIVTKKKFEEFPRDVLNRYNAEGTFFFDEKDRRVKSIIYKDEDDLPRLWNFRDDIDTVYLDQGEVDLLNESKIVSVVFKDSVVPGDFMDWLMRLGYRREFVRNEGALELRIFQIEPNAIEEVQKDIRIFGLESAIIEESELELEIKENE